MATLSSRSPLRFSLATGLSIALGAASIVLVTAGTAAAAPVSSCTDLNNAVGAGGTVDVALGTDLTTCTGLVLPTGSNVTLDLSGHTLTEAGQSSGQAGIQTTGATLTINATGGGTLNATGGGGASDGGAGGAGIGGAGIGGAGGTVTINGGTLHATGGAGTNGLATSGGSGAGIGGGGSTDIGGAGGTVTINGGTLNATGGNNNGGEGGAGIGGGGGTGIGGGAGGTVTINGGTLNATGGGDLGAGLDGAGVGGGGGGAGGTVTVNSGTLNATGGGGSGASGAGVGGGGAGAGGTLTIGPAGVVVAKSSSVDAVIGQGAGGSTSGVLANSGSLTLIGNQTNVAQVVNATTGVIHLETRMAGHGVVTNHGSIVLDNGAYFTPSDGGSITDHAYIVGYTTDAAGSDGTSVFADSFNAAYSSISHTPVLKAPPAGQAWFSGSTCAAQPVSASTSLEALFGPKSITAANTNGHWPPNVMLFAQPIQTVSFDANGGPSAPAAETVMSGCNATAPTTPTWTGHTFNGWYTSATGGTDYFNSPTAITGPTTLYAQWKPLPETITYVTPVGGPIPSQTVPYGTTVGNGTPYAVPPAAPSGYNFLGWTTDAAGTTPWATGPLTSDITVYGQWTVKVTFDSNGGSPVSPEAVPYNTNATAPTAPMRTGYTFLGWFTAPTGGTNYFQSPTAITAPTTLYARWRQSQDTITYVTPVGGPIPSQTVPYGTTVGNGTPYAVAPPAPAGYNFLGWTIDAAGTTPWATGPLTSDITVYGQWSVDVTFDSNGGSPVTPEAVPYNTDPTAPAAPTRVGHTFLGWFTAPIGGTDYINSPTAITAPTTLYAQWQPIPETITYVTPVGGPVPSQTAPYGTSVGNGTPYAPTPTAPTGYNFLGWTTDAAGTTPWATGPLTSDITVYGQWTVNVTFDGNGGSTTATEATPYNTNATTPTAPTRAGYAFTGWFTDPAATMPYQFATLVTAPITLYAGWAPQGDMSVNPVPVIVATRSTQVTCDASVLELMGCTIQIAKNIGGHQVVLATGTSRVTGATVVVTVKLTTLGRKLEANALRGVRATLTATSTITNGRRVTTTRATWLFAPSQTRSGPAMFNPNQATLTRAGTAFLLQLDREAQQVTGLECIGHSALTGQPIGNQDALALSRRRAQVACGFLIHHGLHVVTKIKIRTIGVGNTRGRRGDLAENRYVTVIIDH